MMHLAHCQILRLRPIPCVDLGALHLAQRQEGAVGVKPIQRPTPPVTRRIPLNPATANWSDAASSPALASSNRVTRWAYSQTEGAGGLTWLRADEMAPLAATWQDLIRPFSEM